MDGSISLSSLVTIGGFLVSIAGAAAVGRMQIRVIQDTLADVEARLRKSDARQDAQENQQAVVKQRLDILASLNSPSVLETKHRETAKLLSDVENALERVKHLEKMHNTVHPPVPSERKAV